MYRHERDTLRRIAASLRESFPGRIAALYAFGSRVRGSHSEWSDFDLLVVVRDKDPRIESEFIGMIVDEEIKSGLSFSPVVKDARANFREGIGPPSTGATMRRSARPGRS